MKPKLTLKHLAPYLPYQVKAKFKETQLNPKCRKYAIGTVGAVYDGSKEPTIVCFDTVNSSPDKFKLLLRPLSWITDEVLSDINCDLSTQIEIKDIEAQIVWHGNVSYGAMQILFEHHVDVFGLIEQGLAEPIKD